MICTNASARDKFLWVLSMPLAFDGRALTSFQSVKVLSWKIINVFFRIKFWISFNIIIFTLFWWRNHLLFVEIFHIYITYFSNLILLSKNFLLFNEKFNARASTKRWARVSSLGLIHVHSKIGKKRCHLSTKTSINSSKSASKVFSLVRVRVT